MDAAGLPEIVGTVWARESAGEQPKLCNRLFGFQRGSVRF